MAGRDSSTVKVSFVGDPAPLVRATAVATGALDKFQESAKRASGLASGGGFLSSGTFMAGIVAGAAAATKAAANYQESLTRLVTGAGESEKNIKMVGQGMLDMAGQVGVSAQKLSDGMFMIESAGYHGADGLKVLRAAAEGAKVGGAQMATVADGLTTAMNDYAIPTSKAAEVTSKLVETVALGKTHMEDLAGSLAKVLPAASAAHVGLSQVLGAIATMTSLGTPAADAATYLRQTILQLSNPTAKAAHEMQGLGLSSLDISKNLGARGLTGTLDILTAAIERKMGPAGIVLIESLKKASANTTTFQKILANLSPTQQTYVQALANMVGGTKSMQAALELTGTHAKTFQDNVAAIGNTTTEAGGHVKGWALVQQDLNQKLDKLVASLQTAAIELGTKLIPAVSTGIDKLTEFARWCKRNWDVIGPLVKVVGGLAVAVWAVNTATAACSKTMAATRTVMALFGLTSAATATEVTAVATAEAAVAAESGAAAAGIGAVATASGAAAAGPIALLVGALGLAIYKFDQLASRVSNAPGDTKSQIGYGTPINPNNAPDVNATNPIWNGGAAGDSTAHPNTDEHGHASGALNMIRNASAATAAAAAHFYPSNPGPGGLNQALAAGSQAAAANQALTNAAQQRAAAVKQAAAIHAAAVKAAAQQQAQALRESIAIIRQALADRNTESTRIAKSIAGSASIVQSGILWQSGDLLAMFRTKMQKVQRFARLISEIVHKGYAASIVSQVAEAGPDAGMATAQALASANAPQVRGFNAASAAIDRASGFAGDRALKGTFGEIHLTTQIMLNDRVLAEAVNKFNSRISSNGARLAPAV